MDDYSPSVWDLPKTTKIGFMPDRHSLPGYDKRPTIAMARFFREEEVDVVVDIGDRFDMPSLSSYDKGKTSFEGRRLSKDLDCARQELDLFRDELKGHNPYLIHTRGNHCERMFRMYDEFSEMHGAFGDDPWGLEEAGYYVYAYQQIVNINGVRFSHNFQNPTSLIGSIQSGSSDIRMKNIGVPHVQGHQHGPFFHAERLGVDGNPLSVLLCGASYTEHHSYNGLQRQNIYRGAGILSNVHKGRYDLNMKDIYNLIKEYK